MRPAEAHRLLGRYRWELLLAAPAAYELLSAMEACLPVEEGDAEEARAQLEAAISAGDLPPELWAAFVAAVEDLAERYERLPAWERERLREQYVREAVEALCPPDRPRPPSHMRGCRARRPARRSSQRSPPSSSDDDPHDLGPAAEEAGL
jgi:hypothetical protein